MKENPLVARLEALRDAKNRAALSRLRRGLGKRMGTPEMFPYVVPYLPDSPWEQAHYFLIASLFALHPQESPRGVSFGTVFGRIWRDSNKSDSIEKRFKNLLSADPDDVAGHLRHAVSLAKSCSVPVDYHRLLYNLKDWERPDRRVQLAWARDFWGSEKTQANDTPPKGEES